MANVKLEGITRRVGNTTIIHDISFEVPDGAFWVLVGPSGCGKSTILRTIAGLEPVMEGCLFIGESLVNKVPARQRDVAMVFQNYALYPHMTVAENLGFGLRMRKADPGYLKSRVESVAKSLDIAHLLDRKPRQLSGGQQQRVALGRAIARQPQVFLLDEPLSNLDAQLRDETRAELKQLHHQFGVTTIYVTHDQVEAMTLADQIVVLEHGKIQQIGSPQAIYTRPVNKMVATFIGNPPMNILEARVTPTGLYLDDQVLPCPPDLISQLSLTPGQLIHIGIRPEHIQVASSNTPPINATILLVEPLGRETLVRVALSSNPSPPPTDPSSNRHMPQLLNLHIPPNLHPQPGDIIPLHFNPNHIYVFDPATGQTL